MRVRVQSSWRTRLLFLLAFVAAGLIAYDRMQIRMAERRAAAAERAAQSAPGVVEVEIFTE